MKIHIKFPVDEIVNVKKCVQCKQDHENMPFKKLNNAMQDADGNIWEYYGICPVTNDPVFMNYE